MNFPNAGAKKVGDYVWNVHPCSRYDDGGVVTMVTGCIVEGDTLSVQTGRGSTCYGPAVNWMVVDAAPRWLDAVKADEIFDVAAELVAGKAV